jgi:serralysin
MATYDSNSVPITPLDLDGLPMEQAALIDGSKWGAGGYGTGVGLTYSFPLSDSGTALWAPGYGAERNVATGLDAVERAAVVQVLDGVAQGIDVTFSPVAESGETVGEMRFTGMTAGDDYAFAYTPGGEFPDSGDVWFGPDWFLRPNGTPIEPGSYEYMTIVHEVGHALGLKHPFESGESGVTLPPGLDNYVWTVMSYSAYAGAPQSVGADFYPTTLMYLDLLALEDLYGPPRTAHLGNTSYVFHENQTYWETIVDSGGIDTVVYDSAAGGAYIDLSNVRFSHMGRAIHYFDGTITRDTIGFGPSTVIENATGGNGDDTLVGNGVANRLLGRGGDDSLTGAGGSDFLDGGGGTDRLAAGGGFDTLVWRGGDIVDGGSTNGDVLRLASGDLDLTRLGSTRIQNVERIDMAGGGDSVLKLARADVLDLSSTINVLRVLGDGGDTLDIVGARTDQGIADGFHRYTLGTATLLVDQDIHVV